MNNIELLIVKNLYYLIENFNKNLDAKYINIDNINSIENFIKDNETYLLETIDYIEEYLNVYNKLCKMNLNGVEVPSNGLYDLNYLETLINLYIENNNNYIINNILYTQREVISNNLNICKRIIEKMNKLLECHSNAINSTEKSIYNNYINKMIAIFSEEDDDSGTAPLDELLYGFRNILKSSYKLKKKNIKIKVLARY